MPLTAVPFAGFGSGLDLTSQPSDVAPTAAIDLLNVVFTERGAVKQRDGYGILTAAEGTNRYDSLAAFYTSAGTVQLVAGAGSRIEALDTTGAIVATQTGAAASPQFFSRFGGPTAELLFITNGSDPIRQWNGAAFSSPATTGTAPTGKFLAVTPWDNRLVNARRTGATAGDSPSTVRFSDPGVPLAWPANNYIELAPGDGEAITGMAVYQDRLIVFKESRFFTFYGTGSDSTGLPIFNYHAVDTGIGSSGAMCVGRDGVYFLNSHGIYRTTGGAPVLVSGQLDPFFQGSPSDFYLGGTLAQASIGAARMVWHDERIYVTVPTGASSVNTRILVTDPRFGWWSLYDLPAAALATFKIASRPELVFALSSGLKHIGRHSAAFLTDNAAAVNWRWRSGWFDYGSTSVKTIREAKLWGKGALRIGIGRDYQTAKNAQTLQLAPLLDRWGDGTTSDTWGDGTNAADLWASGVSLKPKLYRSAVRGTVFSVELSNSGPDPCALYKLSTHLRGQRTPTVVETEVAA